MPAFAQQRSESNSVVDDFIVDGVVDESLDDAGLEEDDENIVPERSSALQSGWDAANSATDTGKYSAEFKFTEKQQLVKFLESAPFAVFKQHWITRTGKKSFVCLGPECPLCGIGDTPRPKVAFSVVNLNSEKPAVEILLASQTLTRQLSQFDSDPKTGPLDRMYWSMSKSGVGQKTTYSVLPVKPRDLADDWGADIVQIEGLIDTLVPLTDSAIYVTPRHQLVEIAREVNSSL